MRKIISFLILLLFFISSNNAYVYAINDNKEILKNKIEKIKLKQKAKEKKYAEVLGQVDTIIDDYQGKIDKKGELYKKRNKKKIHENLKKVKQKKLEVIGLANKKLKENLEKDIQVENISGSIQIEPNYLFELQENQVSNDTYYDNQWGLKNLLGEYNNNSLLFSGEKITVAVIDTGVNFSQNDLTHAKWTRDNCYDENNQLILGGCLQGGYDFIDNDTNPFPSDNYTHGNSVAGIIAAKTNNNTGMASLANDAVEIMSLRTCCGDSNYFGAENIARAIYFAVNNDAKIINASFGGPTYSKVIEDALIYARDSGVLVIAAAGNYGSNNDTNPLYPASYDLDNIISVGSNTPEDILAYFSNYGSNTVDIVAPGENIYSLTTGNNIGTVNGTSFSTPFTTSIAARYISQNPDLTYADIIDNIYSHSTINIKLSGSIKNNLQLKLDSNSLVNPVSDTIDTPVDPVNPGEENPEPTDPTTNPIDSSNGELDEQYSNIMKQVALFRQTKISQNTLEKHISFQELNSLENTLQDYIYSETEYLERRPNISSDKKLKYLDLLDSQLELVKNFNTEINTQTQIQSFSTLTQEEQQAQISQILGSLGIEPLQEVEPQILDDMSSFSFGENSKELEHISNIKAIESKSQTSLESSVIQGIIPQEISAINTTDLSSNSEIIIDETIQNLAEELGNNPVNIFNYVRNSIKYEAYYGSKKSSISCLQDKICNDVDQTNLTLALLRASGMPAKYQTSWILVSKENISKLLGVPDIKMALYALRTADIPAERVNTGQSNFSQTTDFDTLDMSDDEYLAIEWTRALALVKYDHLGGNYNNDFYLDSSFTQTELEAKISEQNNLEWISIDPSFVFHQVQNHNQDVRTKNISERKDLLQSSNINISTFFTDYVKDIQNIDMSEIFKQELISNNPSLNILSADSLDSEYNTYLYTKTPETIEFDTLPLSQAYTGVEVTRDGVVISEKIFSELDTTQKQYLEISLKRQSNDEIVFRNKYSVDEVNNTPVTLDYIGATDTDRQTIIDKGSLHLTPADLVDLHVSIDTQAQATETLTTPQTVKIGEGLIMTFTYTVGGEVINTSSKYALGGNSEGIYMSFGAIPEDSMDSDSKVLLAGNWAIAKRYLERITQYNKSLEQIVGSVNDLHYTRAVVTQNRVLNPIGDTATTLDFKGLSLDAHTFVKDYTLSDYDTHTSRSTDIRKLFGLYASEQEGQIFDDITGLTGISTTRGLQYAYNSPDYTVYEIDNSNKSQIESLGFSENTKQSMRDYVDESRTIITPDSMVSNQNWQGIFYIAIAENGEGMYAIGENVVGNGGYTVDQVNKVNESTSSVEYACNGDGNSLANTSTCRFIQTENTVNSCQSLYGNEDLSSFSDIDSSNGYNKNIHGEMIGKMNYFSHSIIISENAIKFGSNPNTASEKVFEYWETCAEMKSKVNEYLNTNNRPFTASDKEKISAKVGTYMVWQPNQEIATYYSPEENQNYNGGIYSLEGEFLSKANKNYGGDKSYLAIEILGPPTGDEFERVKIINDIQFNYKQQNFLNGFITRYENFYNIFPNSYYTAGDLAKYWKNNPNIGLPKQDPTYSNSIYITQSFDNDKLIKFHRENKTLEEITDGKYLCHVGDNNKYKRGEDDFILKIIGFQGMFDSGVDLLLIPIELGIGIGKGIFRTKDEISSNEYYLDDLKQLLELLNSLKTSDILIFLKSIGMSVEAAIVDELTSENKVCDARQSYTAGRVAGLVLEGILTSGIGTAGKVGKAGTKIDIKQINIELDLVKNNTSPDLSLDKRIDIIKKFPCALGGTNIQSISFQGTAGCRPNITVGNYDIEKIDNLFVNFETHFKKHVEKKLEFGNINREEYYNLAKNFLKQGPGKNVLEFIQTDANGHIDYIRINQKTLEGAFYNKNTNKITSYFIFENKDKMDWKLGYIEKDALKITN